MSVPINTPQRAHTGGAAVRSLALQLDPDDLVATVDDNLNGWPSGLNGVFFATIGRGTPNEERVLCSASNGKTLTILTRGVDDTLATTHSQGETVEHTFSALEADEANSHIIATGGEWAHGSDGPVVGRNTMDAALGLLLTVPIGAVVPYAGDTAPEGWYLCDGSAVPSSSSGLFPILGTRYGPGSADTTVTLPDLRGRSVFGLSSSDTAFDALGEKAGAKSVQATLAEANLPQHQHTTPALSHSVSASEVPDHSHGVTVNSASASHKHAIGNHTHTVSVWSSNEWIPDGTASDFRRDGGGNGSTKATFKSLGSVGTAMDGGAGDTTTTDPAHSHSASSANAGRHTPSVTVGGHGAGITGSGNGAAAPITVATLPPYMVLNFIIRGKAVVSTPRSA